MYIKGNSGCKIKILENNIIRKSCKKDYNDRLRKQMLKQLNNKDMKLNNIHIPDVINYGYDNKEFYFDMDYYNYYNYAAYFLNCDKESIDNMINVLFDIVYYYHSYSKETIIKFDIIQNKFESIIKYLDNKRFLRNIFNKFPKENIKLREGKCHGDLTFSNMLFKGSKCILIDFLDSFIESPIQDMVKLRQDTKYYWSINFIDNKYDRIKLKLVMDYIDKMLDERFQVFNYYKKYYKLFQFMNLSRIMPYVCSEYRARLIEPMIMELMNV